MFYKLLVLDRLISRKMSLSFFIFLPKCMQSFKMIGHVVQEWNTNKHILHLIISIKERSSFLNRLATFTNYNSFIYMTFNHNMVEEDHNSFCRISHYQQSIMTHWDWLHIPIVRQIHFNINVLNQDILCSQRFDNHNKGYRFFSQWAVVLTKYI